MVLRMHAPRTLPPIPLALLTALPLAPFLLPLPFAPRFNVNVHRRIAHVRSEPWGGTNYFHPLNLPPAALHKTPPSFFLLSFLRTPQIDVDVYRRIAPVRSEPWQGTNSFLQEHLMKWRELNSASHFLKVWGRCGQRVCCDPWAVCVRRCLKEGVR